MGGNGMLWRVDWDRSLKVRGGRGQGNRGGIPRGVASRRPFELRSGEPTSPMCVGSSSVVPVPSRASTCTDVTVFGYSDPDF